MCRYADRYTRVVSILLQPKECRPPVMQYQVYLARQQTTVHMYFTQDLEMVLSQNNNRLLKSSKVNMLTCYTTCSINYTLILHKTYLLTDTSIRIDNSLSLQSPPSREAHDAASDDANSLWRSCLSRMATHCGSSLLFSLYSCFV